MRSGFHTCLDLHSKIDFLRTGKQLNAADFLQIHANRIAREHGHAAIAAAMITRFCHVTRAIAHLGKRNVRNGFQLFLGNAFKQLVVGFLAGLGAIVFLRLRFHGKDIVVNRHKIGSRFSYRIIVVGQNICILLYCLLCFDFLVVVF